MTEVPRRPRDPEGPPAGPGALMDTPLHRLVMRWPEMLAVLEREGVAVEEEGGGSLRAVRGGEALAAELVRAAGWRR